MHRASVIVVLNGEFIFGAETPKGMRRFFRDFFGPRLAFGVKE
jgi:hypothetical protein